MFRLAGPLYRFSLPMPGMATALHMLAELRLTSAVVLLRSGKTLHRSAAALLILA